MDMPLIGLGTWPMQGDECRRAVAEALALGYRHIDTAQMYGNEAAVGAGLRDAGVPRDRVWVTSKVHYERFRDGSVEESAKASVDALGGPPDLMLVHWPPAGVPVAAVMAQMVALREAGLARAIGVSNFTARMLREAAQAGIVTNQVEFHCLIDQSALKAEADALGIRLTAYSPVAKGRVFEAPPVRAAAERLGRTPAQVALRWIVQQRVAAIPKSSRREGLAENLAALDFALPPQDMAAIGALTAGNRRFVTPSWAPDWDA